MSQAQQTAAAEPSAAPTAAGHEATRKAGRASLALSGAKVFFILLGLVQQIALFRVIGIAAYGALRTSLAPASIVYNPIVVTGIQGLSRVSSQAKAEEEQAAVRFALRLQALIGSGIAVLFFVLSGPLADFLESPHIAGALRLLSVAILSYSCYAPLIGILNGRRRFLAQAGLDMMAAVLRTGGLVAGGFWAAHAASKLTEVEGATAGFAVSAVVTLLVAVRLVGLGKRGPTSLTVRGHLGFIGPVWFGQLVLNLLLQADSFALRVFAAQAAETQGLPPQAADPFVGAYGASQLFGFLPYQLMMGISFVLFPMLAKADQERDRDAVGRYVSNGVRAAMIIAGALISVTSALAAEWLTLVFSPEAAHIASKAMTLLVCGLGAFAIFGTLVTVLNSIGRQWHAMSATAVTLFLVLGLCGLLVKGQSLTNDLLWRTAMSTTAAMVLATGFAAFLVYGAAGRVVPWLTVGRVIAAVVVARWLGGMLTVVDPAAPGSKIVFALGVLVESLVAFGAYVVMLTVLRELGRHELDVIKAIALKRSRRS